MTEPATTYIQPPVVSGQFSPLLALYTGAMGALMANSAQNARQALLIITGAALVGGFAPIVLGSMTPPRPEEQP